MEVQYHLFLKVGRKNFLFLGDAHPTSITQKGLTMFGYNADTPINAEMVKLSHHGSKGNTSLGITVCNKFFELHSQH